MAEKKKPAEPSVVRYVQLEESEHYAQENKTTIENVKKAQQSMTKPSQKKTR